MDSLCWGLEKSMLVFMLSSSWGGVMVSGESKTLNVISFIREGISKTLFCKRNSVTSAVKAHMSPLCKVAIERGVP